MKKLFIIIYLFTYSNFSFAGLNEIQLKKIALYSSLLSVYLIPTGFSQMAGASVMFSVSSTFIFNDLENSNKELSSDIAVLDAGGGLSTRLKQVLGELQIKWPELSTEDLRSLLI